MFCYICRKLHNTIWINIFTWVLPSSICKTSCHSHPGWWNYKNLWTGKSWIRIYSCSLSNNSFPRSWWNRITESRWNVVPPFILKELKPVTYCFALLFFVLQRNLMIGNIHVFFSFLALIWKLTNEFEILHAPALKDKPHPSVNIYLNMDKLVILFRCI